MPPALPLKSIGRAKDVVSAPKEVPLALLRLSGFGRSRIEIQVFAFYQRARDVYNLHFGGTNAGNQPNINRFSLGDPVDRSSFGVQRQ